MPSPAQKLWISSLREAWKNWFTIPPLQNNTKFLKAYAAISKEYIFSHAERKTQQLPSPLRHPSPTTQGVHCKGKPIKLVTQRKRSEEASSKRRWGPSTKKETGWISVWTGAKWGIGIDKEDALPQLSHGVCCPHTQCRPTRGLQYHPQWPCRPSRWVPLPKIVRRLIKISSYQSQLTQFCLLFLLHEAGPQANHPPTQLIRKSSFLKTATRSEAVKLDPSFQSGSQGRGEVQAAGAWDDSIQQKSVQRWGVWLIRGANFWEIIGDRCGDRPHVGQVGPSEQNSLDWEVVVVAETHHKTAQRSGNSQIQNR